MGCFAVIDTETNWEDQVMSIGTVVADSRDFSLIGAKYHVLPLECQVGGMFENTLFIKTPVTPILSTREAALEELTQWFAGYEIRDIFAYNAGFDRNHLPELRSYQWHDIMRLAAYRQTNPKIPPHADCFSTGRMKRGYGVEAMLRLLRGSCAYRETHNAIWDALDELEILKLLGHPLSCYPAL